MDHREGGQANVATVTQTLSSQGHTEPNNPTTSVAPHTRSPPSPGSTEKLDDQSELRDGTVRASNNHLPPVPPARLAGDTRLTRPRTAESRPSTGPHSGIDWIVPLEDKPVPRRTVGERLQPTLDTAILEKEKYSAKAKLTGYAINAAIGLQVLLGSLITGLSAALSGKQGSLATTILGGMNTIIAAYLARTRGSNEPELSITRVKDLEQFIRECQAFQMDHGHVLTGEFDQNLKRFRDRFEELLGNASGERKLAMPV